MNQMQKDFIWARIENHMKQEEVIKCVLSRGTAENRMKRLSVLVAELAVLAYEQDRTSAVWHAAGNPEL
jgi:hypothetical protein